MQCAILFCCDFYLFLRFFLYFVLLFCVLIKFKLKMTIHFRFLLDFICGTKRNNKNTHKHNNKQLTDFILYRRLVLPYKSFSLALAIFRKIFGLMKNNNFLFNCNRIIEYSTVCFRYADRQCIFFWSFLFYLVFCFAHFHSFDSFIFHFIDQFGVTETENFNKIDRIPSHRISKTSVCTRLMKIIAIEI